MNLNEVTYKIDLLKSELDKLRPLKPSDEQRVMQKFRLDWNYNSNNIEGNSLSYGETKALLLFGITAQGKPLKDHLEIEGHNEAIDYIVKISRNEEPLTEAMIRSLHKIILHEEYEIDAITADGQPTKKFIKLGKYKTTPNHVKTITGEIFRFATPEETPAKMEELLKWYRENFDNPDLHPLVFSVEFHYRFIRIHPFDDGNGRIVRLLMNLVLMQKGFPPVIVKAKDKEEYFRSLQQADSGNIEPFYIFVGNQLTNSLNLILSAAKGEDIEEPDDIDKEIALLKEELRNQESLKELKSKETITKFIQINFPSFKSILIDNFKSLSDLFLSTEFIIKVGNQEASSGFLIGYNNDVLEIISQILKSKYITDLQKLELNVRLINFTKKIDDPFSCTVRISVFFDNYHYSVLLDNDIIFQKKLYHQVLKYEELTFVAQQSKKKILEIIKQKLGKE